MENLSTAVKIEENRSRTPLGELTALPKPILGGRGWLPLPKNSIPTFGTYPQAVALSALLNHE